MLPLIGTLTALLYYDYYDITIGALIRMRAHIAIGTLLGGRFFEKGSLLK